MVSSSDNQDHIDDQNNQKNSHNKNIESHQEQILFHEELFTSYLEYGRETLERAIPSVIDGCKKVHRRILYAMYKNNYRSNKRYIKCAAVVGATISEFHPHGDMSIYNALVRLAQDFVLKHPLIDGQGNFGSIDGDSAAAYRYTECKLAKIGELLLEEIEENTTDFQSNYDGSSVEPVHLVPQYPAILIGGAQGIGVGYSSNIPTHNLGEVLSATLLLLDNPDATLRDIMNYIQGPDLPTAGIISSKEGVYKAYEKGEGMIKIRGKAHFEGEDKILITEIPYQVQKSVLVAKIIEVAKNGNIDGISSVKDQSDSKIRVVIELKRKAQKEVVLNQIYQLTPLSISYKINLLALNKEGLPELFPLKKILESFINFRHSTIIRKTTDKIQKYQERINILFGYAVVLDNINTLVDNVKSSEDTENLRNTLLEKKWASPTLRRYMKEINMDDQEFFSLSEVQVKSILDLKLTNLTKMAAQEVVNQINTIRTGIIEGRKIIDDYKLRTEIIRENLQQLKKYATARETVIEDSDYNFQDEDFIPKEEVVITLSMEGYLKRVPLNMYREQKRGGKGSLGFQNNQNDKDYVLQVLVVNSHDQLLIFTDIGKVYNLKVHHIPEGDKNTKGRFVLHCLEISENEKIIKILPLKQETNEIVFVTNQGTIRKNRISDFSNLRSNGKIYMKPKDNIKVVDVVYTSDEDEIMLFTKLGKAVKFDSTELRIFDSRNSLGVRGCKLSRKNDQVISLISMNKEEREKLLILTITSNGLAKSTEPDKYRKTSRGTQGVINIKLKENTYVVGAIVVTNNSSNEEEENNILVVTHNGQIVNCATSDIRSAGRVTQGVIIVNLKQDDYIVSIAKV